jgi:hypothetical protein
VHWIKEGVIGKIKRVVLCSNRPGAIETYRFVGPRPAEPATAPEKLNWDLWPLARLVVEVQPVLAPVGDAPPPVHPLEAGVLARGEARGIVDLDRARGRGADREPPEIAGGQRIHDVGAPPPQPDHLVIDCPAPGQAISRRRDHGGVCPWGLVRSPGNATKLARPRRVGQCHIVLDSIL